MELNWSEVKWSERTHRQEENKYLKVNLIIRESVSRLNACQKQNTQKHLLIWNVVKYMATESTFSLIKSMKSEWPCSYSKRYSMTHKYQILDAIS